MNGISAFSNAPPSQLSPPLSGRVSGLSRVDPSGEDPSLFGLKKEATPSEKLMKQGEGCQTCENRRYQDGSDDAGVSFQSPTKISPGAAPIAVANHENQHVVREQAKAHRENKRVVSQTVTYSTAVCPECHRSYVSGGMTRTVTKTKPEMSASDLAARAIGIGNHFNTYA